ncbi:MAG: GntR family transcriptional regulator [Aestuariivirgaceae bacterium]
MPVTSTLTKVTRQAAEPLRDQILQRCRLMLMGGHVVPGQKLPLRPLAEEFNTSLMPVRDALNRLVADGALELSKSRTIRVPNMTDERLNELHEIRRSLEGLAAEYATPLLPNSAIDRLEQLIAEMETALAADDYDTYISSHYSFHFTIYAAAGRSTLLGMIDMLWLQVGPWFRQGIERANTMAGKPNAGHQNIVKALRARDPVATRTSVEQDVFANIEYIRKGVFP